MSQWSNQDLSALLGLIAKFRELYAARAEDMRQRKELDARIANASSAISKLSGVFALYGIDTSKQGWSSAVREIVGDETFESALSQGLPVSRQVVTVTPAVENDPGDDHRDDKSDGTVREIAIERLKAAGESGTTARAIQDYIESARSIKLHYKTVGMTLYRLSREGVARREGRNWFFVSETKNPGGETPGSSNLFN